MMPMTRQEIEILLDAPDQRGYVLSAYADLTVKDGFHNEVERHLRNQAQAAAKALALADARKDLDANIEAILRAVRDNSASPAKGLAVFSSVAQDLLRVIPLSAPVENQLVLDEEPYVLPLLEQWYGEPVFLIVVVDSDEAHLFESHAGAPEPVGDLQREDVHQNIERDKPRFTYKKRFAQTRHERLHDTEQDKFLQEVAHLIDGRWQNGRFNGLVLLGQAQITAPLRRLLHKNIQKALVEEAAQAMTTRSHELADDVARVMERWHQERDEQILAELQDRWKTNYLVANGPTDVLDALQQGRAVQIVIGSRRDLVGAQCQECGYRFGAPCETCSYCQGRCRSISATQEVLRMALRHRIPVHLFRRGLPADPLAQVGGVSALVRAEANWAPDPRTARASEGH